MQQRTMGRFFTLRAGMGILLAVIAIVFSMRSNPTLADNPLAPAAQFAGKFSDGKVTLELSPSGSDYTGTIALGDQKFPAKASAANNGLTGTFTASGSDYPFTAAIDGNHLVLTTGNHTYTLTNAAAPAPQGGGSAPPSEARKLGDFNVLGSTQKGKTLFIKLPAAQSLESAIIQTADDLGKVLDGKPNITGAFADSQTKTHGGAVLTAKFKGADIHGWIFCSVAGGGAESTVVIALADASRADLQALFAFLPIPLQMKTYEFPDGSGSVDLPPGWTTQQQSLSFGFAVTGPAGQSVVFGNTLLINTPDGMMARQMQQTYQIQMQNYQMQMQNYRQMLAWHRQNPNMPMPTEPTKPTPPDFDSALIPFCRYCRGAQEVLQYLYPTMERKGRKTGHYTTLDKVIEIVPGDPNPYIQDSHSGVVYIAVTDHTPDKANPMRVINRISTAPVLDGKDTWMCRFDVMRAPDATFDGDIPVMNAIMTSIKMNMDVVNKEIQKNGEAVRKMGEENERELLRRNREFNREQQENFERFEDEEQAREQAVHDSASDFIEYIRGFRDVYDNQTGQTVQVGLNNVNDVVDQLNKNGGDPNRFQPMPLRYER